MNQPVIHIGYHKTGSTWFQKELYPQVANAVYVERAVAQGAFLNPRGMEFSPAEAQRLFPSDVRYIVCEEQLSGPPHTGGLHGFLCEVVANRLHKTVPHAKIVVFVRNQYDMVVSSYGQYVRKGGTCSIGRYLNHKYNFYSRIPRFSYKHFKYSKLVAYYDSLFGRENVFVHAFESFQEDRRGFVKRFLDSLGLNCDMGRLNFNATNRGLSRLQCALLRTCNWFYDSNIHPKHYVGNIRGIGKLRQAILKASLLSRASSSAASQKLCRVVWQYMIFASGLHLTHPSGILGQEVGFGRILRLPPKAMWVNCKEVRHGDILPGLEL